jgi:hypothetical protein
VLTDMVDLLSFSAAGPPANYEVHFVFSYSNYHAIDCIKFMQPRQGQSD